MSRVRVKVCGITRPQDAAACAALGVDFLGLIFAASPRQVTPARAGEVCAAAPSARWVGVFVDAPLEELIEVVTTTGLGWVQLHGRETTEYCAALRERCGVKVIRAVSPGLAPDSPDSLNSPDSPDSRNSPNSSSSPDAVGAWGAWGALGAADYLLLDLPKGVPAAERDRRRRALWREAGRYEQRGEHLFLAGGLTPANVREAIAAVGPHAVDVASGVEHEPGIKDMNGVEAFLKEVATCQ